MFHTTTPSFKSRPWRARPSSETSFSGSWCTRNHEILWNSQIITFYSSGLRSSKRFSHLFFWRFWRCLWRDTGTSSKSHQEPQTAPGACDPVQWARDPGRGVLPMVNAQGRFWGVWWPYTVYIYTYTVYSIYIIIYIHINIYIPLSSRVKFNLHLNTGYV